MPSANQGQMDGQTVSVLEEKLDEPGRYRVLMHNDDYTSMDFVVSVLRRVFHKSMKEAMILMYQVHNMGIGECGTYTREVAEAKVGRVHHDARLAGFPLKCTMEKI